ncbi:gamma-secretase activating protein pigeon [Cotesia typhae]|uniref:gamma-secretase activating protein pigeon n=1 Tax=Cotesia typhae TaxID=2053667 RepID=UPI003D68B464
MAENLAAKLCALIPNESVKAEQWKLLGQEKDCSLLVGWIEENQTLDDSLSSHSVIGHYDRSKETLEVLYHFPSVLNIVQATINQNHTLLGYIVKETIKVSKENEETENKDQNEDEKKDPLSDACLDSELELYQAYILELESDDKKIHTVITERRKQVRIQFLYKQKRQTGLDKFIVLIHHECIVMYTALFNSSSDVDTIKELKSETIVRTFTWAQWDSTNQVLYHIHNRRAPTSLVTEEDNESRSKATNSCPTLSGLQFHDELPHETVLNIPLNLPRPPSANNCGTYEDDVIPLRVHDCSLDLIVISNSKGMICVCHHYLYRPIQPPQHVLDASLSDSNTVHFAYSVTLLHHSCVIHCVVPGIPWSQAKLMRPTFAITEDYMLVFVQGSFTHLLEIGASHDPSCHILCGPLPTIYSNALYLVPLLDLNSNKTVGNKKSVFAEAQEVANIMTIDLPTLDLIPLKVTTDFLIDVFKKESSVHVRLGIIHYFMCHKHDLEIVAGLISIIAEKPRALDVVQFMQEILIGNSYSLVQKNLLPDAVPLLSLLPITTVEECVGYDVKIGELNITLSHEKLWNTSVMLLSPQQRLVPYRSDLWTRLWDNLGKRSESKPRFKFSQITEKLLVSLACYQPEVLSRSSTPMSPSGGLVLATGSFGDLMSNRSNKILDSALPFIEMENCTASRQEHIVAVNLRELSMYLLKHATNAPATSYVSCSPLQVHAMATRHIAAQLESSRSLCQMLCRAANVNPRLEQERGFVLIDQLDEIRRNLLFTLLERYRYAIEIIAFPVPQGFSSFFTYLGYRSLKYPMFLQYVERSVFELQVDVTKIIIADISDTKENATKKLHLLSLLPRSRAKRLLNQWLHPVSFMIRAREHAGNILSGEICQNRGRTLQHCHRHNGLAAFPSADRLSPLDTFLDLLTAKASLAELDFGLLIEATVTSTEDFL